MDFGVPPAVTGFRERVRSLFAGDPVQRQLERIAAASDHEGDPRPLYALLGREGVLAVNWPRRYGGAGQSAAHLAVLQEEMVLAGIPDTLHINSVQSVGSFLLSAGTEQQRRKYLPHIAGGNLFASILYSEPESGSDITALATRARAVRGGYTITGTKRFSLKSNLVDYGLCLARTSDEESHYQGLTLFMVPMREPGVRVSRLPGLADEAFHEIELADVFVPDDAVVGSPGNAWPLLLRSLSFERSGVDYYARGQHWLDLAAADVPEHSPVDRSRFAEHYARHHASVDAGRWLAMRTLTAEEDGNSTPALAAIAKWQCSESAQRIAWWLVDDLGLWPSGVAGPRDRRSAAYREAPGMTISAGASELLLEIVARTALDGLEKA